MTTPAVGRRPDHTDDGLGRSDRLQPVLLLASVGVGLAIGELFPAAGAELAPAVSWGVFALLYLVMLNVSLGGVARAFGERRFLGAAVVLNFVVNPLLAWLLSELFLRGTPDLQAGLILFLVTPCIGWYLVFTELAGGDTGLGVSLLGVNVVLQILLLPAYLALFVGQAHGTELATMARSVGLYLVAPAALAAATRWWWHSRRLDAEAAQERLRVGPLKTLTLAAVIVAMFASQADAIIENRSVFGRLVVPMVLFFALAFVVALWAAGHLALPDRQAALLVFTTTSRNSEASLAIAATAFASPLVGLTVVLGPVVELPLLVVMVRVLDARRERRRV